MSARVSSSSLLYKETGVKFDTSEVANLLPRARDFTGKQKVELAFGKAPLLATVDERLSDKAHRVLCLLAVRAVKTRRVIVGFNEVAYAINCSRSTAIRSINELQRLGYIRSDRRHNCRNAYELLPAVFVAQVEDSDVQSPKRRGQSARHRFSSTVTAAANWARIQEEKNSA